MSSSLGTSTALTDINGAEVHSSNLHLEKAYKWLGNGYWSTDEGHGSEETESKHKGTFSEVEQVQTTIECLVSHTHCEQDWLVGVVQFHYWIVIRIQVLVIVLARKKRRVQVQPVAGDVNDHAQLEPEGVTRVELCQNHKQAHGTAAVRELVKHGAKLGALIEHSGCVAVNAIQERTESIAHWCSETVCWHEVKWHDSQYDAAISNDVRNEKENILSHVQSATQ